MIPIIWRFLLTQYLKVTLLSVAAFILVLLTARLDDIVHFASLGASLPLIFQFILFQIPYILPIAIPVGCLISSFLLMQRLSLSHELTALRACGLAFRNILTPILLSAAFLSLTNFYIVSELATSSHFYANFWKEELRSINPLLLLKNKHLMRVRGGYFDVMGSSQMGKTAEKALLALPNQKTGRISLLLAKELSVKEIDYQETNEEIMSQGLVGKEISLITGVAAPIHKSMSMPDHLAIEHSKQTVTSTQDISLILQQNVRIIANDHLGMPLLLVRLQEENTLPEGSKKDIYRIYSEILRRFSVALAVFTLTLMGASFGISITRATSSWKLLTIIFLAAFYLTAYFLAKGVDHRLSTTLFLYLAPHILIICSSLFVLRKAAYGLTRK